MWDQVTEASVPRMQYQSCVSCWHKRCWPGNGAEDKHLWHYRFLLNSEVTNEMYRDSVIPCIECRGEMPLGLSRIHGKQIYRH